MLRKRTETMMKRTGCAVVAGLLTMTSVCSVVLAAPYQDMEKAALARSEKSIEESYAQEMADPQKQLEEGATVKLTLTPTDAGKSLLGLMMPLDISWLNSVGLVEQVAMTDGTMGVDMQITLNDSNIVGMQVFTDNEENCMYEAVPELFDGLIKIGMETMEEAGVEDTVSLAFDMEDMAEMVPDAALINGIMDKYVGILLDGMEAEEESLGTETIEVDGVSQECQVYEGVLYEEGATEAIKTMLTEAQADPQVQELLEKLQPYVTDGTDLNAEFQAFCTEALSDLEAEPVVEDAEAAEDAEDVAEAAEDIAEAAEEIIETVVFGISSKIWTDEEGMIVGREISEVEDGTAVPVLTWKAPRTDSAKGYLLSLNAEGDEIVFSGSGQISGDIMSGAYSLTVSGMNVLNIEMAERDLKAEEEGAVKASYMLYPGISLTEDESMQLFANISIGLDVDFSKEGEGVMSLSLNSVDTELGSLDMEVSLGADVEIPDLASATVYDVASEEDGEALNSSMNFDKILENLTAAGMPEEVLQTIVTMMTQPVEYGYEDDMLYDEYEDDMTYDESVGE